MVAEAAGVLFLHGGPGLSASPERDRLAQLTGVTWWDQPRSSPAAQGAYADLLAAGEAALLACVDRHGAPCHVLSSSFGAAIAVELAQRLPQHIASLVLLAPSVEPELCYVRLARRLIAAQPDKPALPAALERYLADPGDRAQFWQLVGAIVAIPAFSQVYWSPDAQAEAAWFDNLLGQTGMFDFPTFQAVLDDHAAAPRRLRRSPFAGPVSVQFGLHDPLLDPELDAAQWRLRFPQASVTRVDAGHFIHLERPPSEWMPGCQSV